NEDVEFGVLRRLLHRRVLEQLAERRHLGGGERRQVAPRCHAAGEGPARNAGRFGSGLLGARLWRGRVSEQIAEREIALFLLPRAMGERKVERFASVDGDGEANDRRSEWIVG